MKKIYRIRLTDDYFKQVYKEFFVASLPATKKVLKRILESNRLDNRSTNKILNEFEFWKSQVLLLRNWNRCFQTSKYNENVWNYINIEICEENLITK